jgi:aspartate ammonia-lyase
MRQFVEHSIGIVTALVPVLGYEASTEIARDALASGRGVFELVMERGLLTREQLDKALDPEAMTAPRPAVAAPVAPPVGKPTRPAKR